MKIIGTGSAIPRRKVTNEMLTEFLETSDEWISTRTGIKSRRVLSTDEDVTQLAIKASEEALKDAHLDATELDYIICHNVDNDYKTPALACVIQGAIKAKCPCVDMNGACAGFIFSLDCANGLMKAGRAKKILVVCAEHMTKLTDWTRRESCVLFGDGAGAVILTDEGPDCEISLSTVSNSDALYCNAGVKETPFSHQEKKYDKLTMKGKEVFKFAVQSSSHDIQQVMDKAKVTADDVSYFVLHQANLRIVDAIRTYMNQTEEKFPHNIERRGNTSSASVPLLLDEMNKNGQLKEGDIVVFSAFGAGFSSGACLMRW
ncbi:MAG: ketoacyl-ACP synthase III [Paludibacteraceae bacterium]|nr:ketoacyl-ACP synthase III [Paludibacteraceae bacterium]